MQGRNLKAHVNQPYDESVEVGDSEEIASQYTPTPRGDNKRGRGSARHCIEYIRPNACWLLLYVLVSCLFVAITTT